MKEVSAVAVTSRAKEVSDAAESGFVTDSPGDSDVASLVPAKGAKQDRLQHCGRVT